VARDCSEQPLEGLDIVDCRLDLLSTAIQDESPADFGGPRQAHGLVKRIASARKLVDAAKAHADVPKKMRTKLRLSMRQLRTLNRSLQKTIRSGKTPPSIGAYLSDRIKEALAELELQVSATATRTPR
jgi:hypothetical protein